MPAGKQLIEQINQSSPPPDHLAFWLLGQAGIVVKIAGRVVYIDPYLSPLSHLLI